METATKPQLEKLETTSPLVERYAVTGAALAEDVAQFMTPATTEPQATVNVEAPSTEIPAERIFNLKEVTRILGSDYGHVYHEVATGRLKGHRRIGSRPSLFIKEAVLRKYLGTIWAKATYRDVDFSRIK